MSSKHNLVYFIAMVFVIGLVSSCKYSDQPQIFKNQTIQIEYPSYLKESKDVFPVKNLLVGLKNDYRSVYFVLLDYGQKPGDNGFEVMYDSVTTQLKHGIVEPYLEKDTSFELNGFKVRETHISGIVTIKDQEKRMYFMIDLFEDKNGNLYQTSGWCFRHKRDLWQKDLLKIAYSLKPISH